MDHVECKKQWFKRDFSDTPIFKGPRKKETPFEKVKEQGVKEHEENKYPKDNPWSRESSPTFSEYYGPVLRLSL